jgi:hypothetical protein
MCLREQPLLRSHILPELLYRPLYGSTHRIRAISPDSRYLRFVRKGLREPLLCADCERQLGELESDFARTWFGAEGLPATIPVEIDVDEARRTGGSVLVQAPRVDYSRFKLFHLSVLWRASVSSRDEFREVRLGPHEERLRQMLLRGDPGGESDYRIGGAVVRRDGTSMVETGVVSVPSRVRAGDGWAYMSMYAGCLWAVFVSASARGWSEVLQPDGAMVLWVIDMSDLRAVSDTIKHGGRVSRVPRRIRS